MRRESVRWNFTILGEASSQVPAPIEAAHPEVAWAPPIRMRNRIVHGYWDVDMEMIHAAAIDDLPPLIEQVTVMLNELDQTAGGE